MKIVVIGSNGMLGRALNRHFSTEADTELICVDHRNADICIDLTDDNQLFSAFRDLSPDVVINAAANTNIEFCEENPGCAYMINSRFPHKLAELCEDKKAYLVHVSTDHYFCDDIRKKHTEEETKIRLVNEYARTKYAGEKFVLSYPNVVALRTNIVGFARKEGYRSFIEWVFDELKTGTISVYDDFYTSSMHINDFSRILGDILKIRPTGLYNLASSEVASKKEFILEVSRTVLNKETDYTIESIKNHKGSMRADSLGLDTTKIQKLLGYEMPNLEETMRSIKLDYEGK